MSKETQLEVVAVRFKSSLSSYRAETYGQGRFGQAGVGEVMAGGETYDQRPRRRGGSWEEGPLFLRAY